MVEFVAKQVTVPAAELGSYGWTRRTRRTRRTQEWHRAQIREFFGFTECSVADQTEATDWLVNEATEVERCSEHVPRRAAGLAARSALDRGEARLVERVAVLLPEETRARLNEAAR